MRKLMVFLTTTAAVMTILAGGCSVARAADNSSRPASTSPIPQGSSLAGTSWVLKSYGDAANLTTVIAGTNITLTFNATMDEVSGNGGVNGYGGSATVNGNQLTLMGIMHTEMASLNQAVNEQEGNYFQLLGAAQNVTVSGSTLTIACQGGQVLVFNAAPVTAAPIIMATPSATGIVSNTMIPVSESAPASSPTTCLGTPTPVPPPTYISPPASNISSTIIVISTASPPLTVTTVKPS